MKKISVLLLFILYLGVYGDSLALWGNSDVTPVKIFPYKLSVYPVADQQALRHGIPITSPRVAQQLLEDYFS